MVQPNARLYPLAGVAFVVGLCGLLVLAVDRLWVQGPRALTRRLRKFEAGRR